MTQSPVQTHPKAIGNPNLNREELGEVPSCASDTALTPPGTPYGATHGAREKGLEMPHLQAFASPCNA